MTTVQTGKGKKGVPTRQILLMKARGFWPSSEVAEKMGNHISTVYRHIENEEMRAERIGNFWYVDIVSVRKYLGDSMMDRLFGPTVGKAAKKS